MCPRWPKKQLLVCLSFANSNAGASRRTHSFVALGSLLMKEKSMEDLSRLREQNHDGSTNLGSRLICEPKNCWTFYIEFLVRSCLKGTWCKQLHFRPLLHRPALKTKTAQRAKSKSKFSIATKNNHVSNNHNAHDHDDAPTNNFPIPK